MKIEITDYEVKYESVYPKVVEVKREVNLTEEELAVAIMADSIGYASPHHAMSHVKDYLEGRKEAWCERAYTCFNCDLKKLVESAVYYWFKCSEKEKKRLRAFAEAWRKAEERNPMMGSAISVLYPTMGPI